jgi:uncharacterized protein (TIRG00374 family)
MKEKSLPYRIVPGILISAMVLIVLISLSDTDRVFLALKEMKPGILLPAVGLVVISLFTRAFAWRAILQERISLWQSYLLINTGYFVNTVLPFRLGEISRAFLLLPSGFGFWEALPTIVLERIFDVFFALSLLFIGLPSAIGFNNNLITLYILAGLAVLGIVIFIMGVKNRERIQTWMRSIPVKNEKNKEKLVRFTESIFSSLEILNSPDRIITVVVGLGISWGIALIFQFLLLRAFIPDAPLAWAAFALGAVAVGVSLPSSPGNIGLYEGSITLALTACGVDPSLAFTYALTSHIINLVITAIFGAYGLVREGVGLRDIWRLRTKKEEGARYE